MSASEAAEDFVFYHTMKAEVTIICFSTRETAAGVTVVPASQETTGVIFEQSNEATVCTSFVSVSEGLRSSPGVAAGLVLRMPCVSCLFPVGAF